MFKTIDPMQMGLEHCIIAPERCSYDEICDEIFPMTIRIPTSPRIISTPLFSFIKKLFMKSHCITRKKYLSYPHTDSIYKT